MGGEFDERDHPGVIHAGRSDHAEGADDLAFAPVGGGDDAQLGIVDVQQELDAVLGRLEKGLAADVYERVLQLIATEGDDAPTPTPEGTLERFPDP